MSKTCEHCLILRVLRRNLEKMVERKLKPTETANLWIWGCSSAGRAPALQAGGRQFDSVHLHHGRNAASSSEENRKNLEWAHSSAG